MIDKDITIVCDHDGCRRKILTVFTDAYFARKDSALRGWTHRPAYVEHEQRHRTADFCPQHSAKKRKAQ